MSDLVRNYPVIFLPLNNNVEQSFGKDDNELKRIYTVLNSLRGWYKSGTPPTSPNTGDKWDDSSTTPSVLKEWNGSAWVSKFSTFGTALHQPNPISITSATGVLTLLETSNSFIAAGTEAITSITGWTSGIVYIRWNTARTLTYNATSLILQNAVDRVTAIGDVGVYEMTSAGAREIDYFPATQPPSGVQGTFKNLKIQVTSNTQATITADQIVLFNSVNNSMLISSVSATLDKTILGAVNGLDTGVIANSTWYYVWAIAKADGTKGVLMSLSSITPTMPSGYTFKARIGVVKTHSDGTLLRTLQYGRNVQYIVTTSTNTPSMPLMASGTAGTYSATAPTWSSVAVGSFVPPSACKIKTVVNNSYQGATSINVILAPNNNYAGLSSSTGNYPVCFTTSAGAVLAIVDIILESTNVYWVSSGIGGSLSCFGWEDNL